MNVPKFMQKMRSLDLGQGSGTLKSMTFTVLCWKGRKPSLGGFGGADRQKRRQVLKLASPFQGK